MVFYAVFNSISVTSRWPVHLSMLSLSLFNQYAAQYSFQATGCFPHNPCRNNRQRWERNESCHNDYHQSSKRILADWESNQRPPVLNSATLLTELWGLAKISLYLFSQIGWEVNHIIENSLIHGANPHSSVGSMQDWSSFSTFPRMVFTLSHTYAIIPVAFSFFFAIAVSEDMSKILTSNLDIPVDLTDVTLLLGVHVYSILSRGNLFL